MEDPANILFWEEDDVHNFFCSLGFRGYEAQIKEHQVNGEILVQCDHEALKDVGIHSVGQRLAILKAVYQLKLQYDVPIEEGHWVPPSEFIDQVTVDSPAGVIPPDRMFELLHERDERIRQLENSLLRLTEQVSGMRDEVYGLNRALYTKEPPIPINKLRPNQASPTSTGFPRSHLRNGSAHLIDSGGPTGQGPGLGSPAQSPLSSPVRTTHDALHAASSSANGGDQSQQQHQRETSNTSAGGLSYSSSLRRRGKFGTNNTNNNIYTGGSSSSSSSSLPMQNSLLSALNPAGAAGPISPSLATSPLPSSVAASPANPSAGALTSTSAAAEPPTPTASSYLSTPAGMGDHTPVTTENLAVAQANAIASSSSSSSRLGDGDIHIGNNNNNSSNNDGNTSFSSSSQQQRPATAQALSTSPGGTGLMLPNRPSTSTSASPSSTSHGLITPSTATSSSSRKGTSTATATSSSIDNPYKSFKVTLEDPCYKVLPAALKKYKINDDWRQYALFICYGSHERCLSYEEKPLLLFQKLKDTNENPVFMLRHIKDIKSPIALAQSKHAARREKRMKEGKHISGEGREGSIRDFSRATRLHHPTNLQPVKGAPISPNPAEDDKKNGSLSNNNNSSKDDEQKDKDRDATSHHGLGYALAIYPYMADRDDEFDVNVGDTFVILNKTKGWWVVHRDTQAMSESDIVRSGWVPQGCLLETSVPLTRTSSAPLSSSTPINPLSIVSVSTPGLALMDYTQRGSDEITMKKGDKLRVFKRYNYWSYVIKENSGERGWAPSWFVGKLSSSSSGSGSAGGTPTSALATGVSSSSTGSSNASTPHSAMPLSAFSMGSGGTGNGLPPLSAASTNSTNSLSSGSTLMTLNAGDTTPTSATMLSS